MRTCTHTHQSKTKTIMKSERDIVEMLKYFQCNSLSWLQQPTGNPFCERDYVIGPFKCRGFPIKLAALSHHSTTSLEVVSSKNFQEATTLNEAPCSHCETSSQSPHSPHSPRYTPTHPLDITLPLLGDRNTQVALKLQWGSSMPPAKQHHHYHHQQHQQQQQ